jgi:hypothetical protein|nr:MAG TPA: hypothetical protein [Caudoviricetes sp.]
MLIRSQDKSISINMNNVSSIEVGDDRLRIFADNGDAIYDIGEYSTEAKVIKVLDMIQEAYADAKLNEILLPDVCKAANKSQQEKENTSIAKDIRNAFMKKMVFQIPDDESVEV